MKYQVNYHPIVAVTVIILTSTLFGCGQQKALLENDAPIAAPPAIPPAVTHSTEDLMAPKLPGAETENPDAESAKLASQDAEQTEAPSDSIGVESSTINTPTVSRPVRTPSKKDNTAADKTETTAASPATNSETTNTTTPKQAAEKTPANTVPPKKPASTPPAKTHTDIDLPPMLNNTKKPAPAKNIDLKNATITTPTDN